MFSLRAGDSIRERLGGMTSLTVVWFTWMAAFVILEDLEIDSLLVSELQDMQEKTIKINQLDSIIFHFNGCPAFKRLIGSVSQDQSLATVFKVYLSRLI